MGAARRKVVDRADAEQLLDEWELGAEDLPAFCARVGVDGRSLHCWALNLGRLPREERRSDIGLVELAVRGATPARDAVVYRVVVGDLAVEVDDGFREDTLARLLRVVARC
jgi:hypothetical protein